MARPVAVALARAEIAAGSRDKRLIPILRTALHAEPEDPEMAAALSEILWRSGREAEASHSPRAGKPPSTRTAGTRV